MTNVVNLNKRRKALARAGKKARANDNAAKFGLPKSERQKSLKAFQRADKDLDGKKRET